MDVDGAFSDADRDYWIWQPVHRPRVPDLAIENECAIDAFLRDRWRTTGITPAPEADRRTFIRRATFDLHGLPPTPEEVAAFVADDKPLVYERLVDRLLDSPRYGEHWARYWLDLVRFAESDGFKSDDIRPSAWRYRDYVIQALNLDKPYDQFIVEQLAGDELDGDDPAVRTATGYLLLGPYEENGRDVADQRSNILNDITDVTGQVFLGLTIGCARCHDHKFDPILQKDYFRLQAFFAALSFDEDAPLASREEETRYKERLTAWEAATNEVRKQMAELEAPYRAKIRAEKRVVFPDYVQVVLDTPVDRRAPLEVQMAALAERQLIVPTEELVKRMPAEDRAQWEELQTKLTGCGVSRPTPLPRVMIAKDISAVAPPTVVPGKNVTVEPGFLTILDAGPARIDPVSKPSTGRRLALARWIGRPDNPLAARVAVNRIWQQHFGRGIVATSGDFGAQGEQPSHPELLDWLAAQFIDGGFRQKPLHRLIMTSAAYRRACAAPGAATPEQDPDNTYWARFARRRLSAEQLRDAMLATSGELNPRMGGESARSELPRGISAAYAWKADADETQRNRRSIYMFSRRNLREPILDVFDLPDPHECCTRRIETTTAPQALQLMNGQWSLDRARAFAGRVLGACGGNPDQAVSCAYRMAFARNPEAHELAASQRFFVDQRAIIADRLAGGIPVFQSVLLPRGAPPAALADRTGAAALVDFCHVLLNSSEFLYVD
ncbi:MAG: DUF1553 domain-containing protein [Planctomycetia bacterium]|nr:DUF1553 domain-containing protein [Planctomycetia bacterium]